jgi:hypothetical protein
VHLHPLLEKESEKKLKYSKIVLILTKSTILDPRHPQIRTVTQILSKVYSRICIPSRLWPFFVPDNPEPPAKAISGCNVCSILDQIDQIRPPVPQIRGAGGFGGLLCTPLFFMLPRRSHIGCRGRRLRRSRGRRDR